MTSTTERGGSGPILLASDATFDGLRLLNIGATGSASWPLFFVRHALRNGRDAPLQIVRFEAIDGGQIGASAGVQNWLIEGVDVSRHWRVGTTQLSAPIELGTVAKHSVGDPAFAIPSRTPAS